MENNSETQKSIELEQLRKQFHYMAAHPPRFNIFNGEGREAFDEWIQGCRDMEGALREAGEVL